MDKTYAETQGIAPFDWNLFLANPPIIQSPAHYNATALAGGWTTCACGNQCAIIPRHGETVFAPRQGGLTAEHAPIDEELRSLGSRFWIDIGDGDWPQARTTLAAIEARSAVLIREELAKLTAHSPSLPMLVPLAREGL